MTKLYLFLIFLFPLAVNAQQKVTIAGKLIDSLDGSAVGFATVSLYDLRDSSLMQYKIAGKDGSFSLKTAQPPQGIKLVISHASYSSFSGVIRSDADMDSLMVVRMQRRQVGLGEVVVAAEVPPVIIRNDTVEFNANAFRMLPNALLEDLLKKLPGVEVAANGGITFKGRPVSTIRVDGRDFFSGDIRIASKNLPSNIIDKVQIVKEETADDGGDFEQSERHVINLKLKKSIKKGWFGKLYGGGGTNSRYELGSIVNTFSDTLQLSLLGYTNNINKASFGVGDLQSLGGFGRSGMGALGSGNSRLNVNGLSLGGSDDGVQRSVGTGFNLNNEIGAKGSFNLQYYFGNMDNERTESSERLTLNGDAALSQQTDRSNVTREKGHVLSAKIQLGKKSRTSFEYTPLILIKNSTGNAGESTSIDTYSGERSLMERNVNLREKDLKLTNNLSLRHAFAKSGRSLTFLGLLDYDFNKGDNVYEITGTNVPSISGQTRATDRDSYYHSGLLSFADPIDSRWRYRLSGTVSNRKEINRVGIRYMGNEISDPDRQHLQRRNTTNGTLTAGVTLRSGKIEISPSLDASILSFRHFYDQGNVERDNHIFYLLPKVGVRLGQNLTLGFASTVSAPDFNAIDLIEDDTNPFARSLGNIDLKPYRQQRVTLDYMNFSLAGSSLFVSANGTKGENRIIYDTYISEEGLTYVTPVMVDDFWSVGGTASYSKRIPITNRSSATVKASLDPRFVVNETSLNQEIIRYHNFGAGPSLSFLLDLKGIVDLNCKYTYGTNTIDYLGSKLDMLDDRYHAVVSDLVVRYPRNLIVETSSDMQFSNSNRLNNNSRVTRWNASVSYLFLKNGAAQLKLSVIDILNQNNRIRLMSDNISTDRTILSGIPRYGMLSLILNMNTFRKEKVGGGNSLLYF